MGGIEAGDDGRYRCGLVALAVGLIMLGAGASPAAASSLHRLASGTVAFSSDGTRYAAWQVRGDERIVVLDTLTGQRRQITPPAGCKLHDEAEDGEPIISAAAGRFLLTCGEGGAQALLDVQTGRSVLLPKKSNGSSDWYRVGTRYVMGVNVLYDIATGVSRPLKRVADLDAAGASTNAICPAVRRLVVHSHGQTDRSAWAFQGELFAQGTGEYGDVQIDRCHGSPTILQARGGKEGDGAPRNFDLRAGLLSWDTGDNENAGYVSPSESRPYRGSLYAYGLVTHKLETWLLPRLSVEGEIGTFGYSTHTANMVFWIATRTLGGGELLHVETSSIYAASLK
jgi:hypothetical protein